MAISGVLRCYDACAAWTSQKVVFSAKLTTSLTRRVAVIGADAKKKLFSGLNATGQEIRVSADSLPRRRGAQNTQVQNGDDNINEHVYVPSPR